MKYVVTAFMLLGSLAFGEEQAEKFKLDRRRETFGYLIHGYGLLLESSMARDLGFDASDKECQKLTLIAERYLAEGLPRTRRRLDSLIPGVSDIDSYLIVAEGERGEAEKLKSSFFSLVDEVLTKRRTKLRFKELLTQRMIQRGDWSGLIVLHDLRVDRSKLKDVLVRSTASVHGHGQGTRDILRARAAKRLLSEVHDSVPVDSAFGVECEFTLCAKSPGPVVGYDPSWQELLGKATVIRELKLSVAQVVKLRLVLEQLNSKYTLPNATKYAVGVLLTTNVEEMFADWNSAIEKAISEVLTDEQTKRLRELVFQSHLRNLEFERALAGAKFPQKKLDPNMHVWVQSEEHYRNWMLSFSNGMKDFVELVGALKAKSLVGEISLPASVFSDFPEDKVLRETVLAEYLGRRQDNEDESQGNRRRSGR